MNNYPVGVKAVESFEKVMAMYPEIALSAKHGLAVLPKVDVPAQINMEKLGVERIAPAIRPAAKKM